MNKIKAFLRKVFSVPNIKFPTVNLPLRNFVHKIATIIFWTPKKIGWGLRKIMYGITATPGIIARSPIHLYHKSKVWRDWVLEKVDYLEAESAKWKRTFQIAKSPYTILLKMGVSPQYAIGLLSV